MILPLAAPPAPELPPVTASDAAPNVGVPEPILTAAAHYREWKEELVLAGLSEDEVHAAMIARAESQGGVLHAGETINLSSWSERMGIARAVLEALVLAAHRASVVPPPVPLPGAPPAVVDEEEEEAAWTPPPRALRQPAAAGPPSSHHMR